MRVSTLLFVAASAAVSLYASTLEVYRDAAIYRFTPSSTFIGFAPKKSSAECGDAALALTFMPKCPKSVELCSLKSEIEALQLNIARSKQQMDYLDRLIEEARPQSSKSLLELSETAAANYSELMGRKRTDEALLKARKDLFFKMAPSLEPLHISKECGSELKLTLPGGFIGFDIGYEADIAEPKKIAVSKHLHLTNRSGVDIKADEALLYYRPLQRYLQPIRFQPWIIRDRNRPEIRTLQKMAAPMAADTALVEGIRYAKAQQKGARSYKITGLELPSNAERVDIVMESWKNGARALEEVYPYRDANVYRVLKFRPKHPIEAHIWKIKEGRKSIASNVRGEYIDGYYTLFVSVDEDLVVRKKKLILKEKESFFGGSIRKKDGYVVKVVNQSDRRKELTIIERIPVAIRSDIKVRLLGVTSDKKVSYKEGENGKLTIELSVPAHSDASVEVLFEVTFDKDKPVLF